MSDVICILAESLIMTGNVFCNTNSEYVNVVSSERVLQKSHYWVCNGSNTRFT
ncbi:MAG: hypothetical protein ACI8XG_001326 [Congregibacter sp.]|jgi:hypothetical protein